MKIIKESRIIIFLLISTILFMPISSKIRDRSQILATKEDSIVDIDFSYVNHAPLDISGDTELNDSAVSGEGTLNNPYILEGWNITSTTNSGISITGTTKYFVIRNCWIKTPSYYGINITNVGDSTVNITNNICIECSRGIYLTNTPNSIITNNYCSYSADIGIVITTIHLTYLQNNTCNFNTHVGIYLEESHMSVIMENTLIGNGIAGIYLYCSSELEIYDNTILNTTDTGIYFNSCGYSKITWNKIINSGDYGLFVSQMSYENVIHHNYFEDNYGIGYTQAYDDDGNTWYETATNEGNQWSEWDGIDGYHIDGLSSSTDHYPIDYPLLKEKSDIYYELGSTGNSFEWIARDFDPENYEIYKNYELFESGSWQCDVPIIIDINGLNVGIYVYQIIIFDQLGNHAFDTVLVNVVDTTTPEIISSPSELTFDYGSTGNNVTWIATDLDSDSYIVLMNNTFFVEDNWSNGTEIVVDLDSLNVGSYNCTIVICDSSGNDIRDTVFINVKGTIISEYIFLSLSLITIQTVIILSLYIKRKKSN